MTDSRKLGPLGQGGESRPVTVDLTRIDIRRGTLYLPRRFFGALPEGEVQASDTVAGRAIPVRFQPPRQLEGLGPFYEEHDLRPNDGVALLLTDVLQLTAVRRERRQNSPRATQGATRGAVEGAARDAAQAGQEQEARPGPIPSIPPPPELKAGWQDVLHDPVPRRHPAGTSGPAPGLGNSGQSRQDEREGPGWEPESRAHLERLRPEARVQQAERARRETGKALPVDSEKPQERARAAEQQPGPLAHEAVPPKRQQGLFDERAAAHPRPNPHLDPRPGPVSQLQNESLAQPREQQRGEPRAQQRIEPRSEPRSEPHAKEPAEKHVRAEKPEPVGLEREPVAVGAPGQEDAAGRISSYLRDPGTPAIVRAAAVAEELRLPLETVQRGLAEVSRASEGAVAPIRPDVYLVKRSQA